MQNVWFIAAAWMGLAFIASILSIRLGIIDPESLHAHLRASLTIGVVSFLVPFLGAWAFTYWVTGWDDHGALIAGIALFSSKDGRQSRRLAAGSQLRFRDTRKQLYHRAHGHWTHFRHHLRAVWFGESLHQSNAIHRARHRRHFECRGSDADRTDILLANPRSR